MLTVINMFNNNVIYTFSHLFGMYAFGLVEIESYKKAENNAKKVK